MPAPLLSLSIAKIDRDCTEMLPKKVSLRVFWTISHAVAVPQHPKISFLSDLY